MGDGSTGRDGRQYVGIDLHRRRSVIVRQDRDGNRLGDPVRINNDSESWDRVIAAFGPAPEVVVEATYGWYWLADRLTEAGAGVHLAHPLGVKGFKYRRVKNDELDAADLADLLRMGRLPEAWIAPPATRELRELVRYRHKLVGLRSSCKAQVHSVLAKAGVLIAGSDLFGVDGRARLDNVELGSAYRLRVDSLLGLIDTLDAEIDRIARLVTDSLTGHPGYTAIQALPGVGPVLAAVFVAEIGDVTRFRSPEQLCSWAGLTPRHYESDTTVHRGHITKQGSPLVRWAAVEAIQRATTPKIKTDRARIEGRRGRNIGKVAAAHKLLTLVFYGLRDGHIRALAGTGKAA
jgi:transposase